MNGTLIGQKTTLSQRRLLQGAAATGEAQLIQSQQAAQAGEAPAYISMMATVGVSRGNPSILR